MYTKKLALISLYKDSLRVVTFQIKLCYISREPSLYTSIYIHTHTPTQLLRTNYNLGRELFPITTHNIYRSR